METLWFIIISAMLTMYVILDGFDLGAGILHLVVGKSETDRRTILGAIGPVWDGNEVWLIAAGGSLYAAFPLLYASSFSGFYLPLIMVLWLLMLRGLGIELRHQVDNDIWRAFWDTVFSFASILLAVFFGAALGNVVRGVPLDEKGYFFEPLWTTFTVVPESGILDWFTVLMGGVAFCTLALHGANYIATKTEGEMQTRARRSARHAWWGTTAASALALASTFVIRPGLWDNYLHYPIGFLLPLVGFGSLFAVAAFHARGADKGAFISSALFIAGMLSSTAFGLYPNLLPASTDPLFSLTIYNASSSEYSQSVAIIWWLIGMMLAIGYTVYVYRSFKGKIRITDEHTGY